MYQIKNVVNYDREALDREVGMEMERFHGDKRISRLMKLVEWVPRVPVVVSTLSLFCSTLGICLILFGNAGPFSFSLGLVALGLSFFNMLVFRPKTFDAMEKYTKELRVRLDSYCNSPSMRYHSFVVQHGVDGVEMWGAETGDSKFEVTLSKEVDGKLKKQVIVFQYDERNPAGVLTLDVGNETVRRLNN